MFGNWLRNRSDHEALTGLYFERPDLLVRLKAALETRKHLIVYGRPKYGKSFIVRKGFEAKPVVTLTASRDINFSDIFRTYLMTLGCSITVESKKKKSVGSKAEVKFPWPFSPSASIEGQLEGEVTTHNFTADINSANDICYLLRQMRSTAALVIDHFELMRGKQRDLLVESLPMMFENGAPQITLISSTPELPLDYQDRIQLASCMVPLQVPALTPAENDSLVEQAFAELGCPLPPAAKSTLYGVFDGCLGFTLDACSLIASQDDTPASSRGPRARDESDKVILSRIHEQTRDYFLSFLSALIEKEWTLLVSYRTTVADATPPDKLTAAEEVTPATPPAGPVEEQPPAEASAEGAAAEEASAPAPIPVPMDEALALDEVYGGLRDAVQSAAQARPEMPEELLPLYTQANELGRQILARSTGVEPSRLVAFALTQFLSSPTSLQDWNYVPVREEYKQEVNIGAIFCQMLLEADLSQSLVVTAEALEDFFHTHECLVDVSIPRYFRKIIRRIRKLKRTLRVDPYVFAIDEDLTSCTLWDEQNLKVFGDIKPYLKELLDSMSDEGDD